LKHDTELADAGVHEEHPAPRQGRRLPAAAQGLLLLIFGGILVAVLFVLPAIVGLASPSPDDADTTAGSGFKPNDRQWAELKIMRVADQAFSPQVDTEGKIAIDDDLNTPVFSAYSGRVTRVMARAGDVVVAGAPLFAVQASELAQAENDMVSGLATLRTAHAQLELASANEARQHQLYLGHGAALKDWQQSRVDLATAQGGLNSAEIAVAAVRNRLAILGASAHDIAMLESTSNLQHVSADTIVHAPIGGTITQRQIALGQNIVGSTASAGAANPVFTIGNLDRVWMVANVREEDAPLIHLGDEVHVTVPAYPGRVFDAHISYVAAGIDPNTHRMLVHADVENPDHALKPEMFADFSIVTAAGVNAPAVPIGRACLGGRSRPQDAGDTRHRRGARPARHGGSASRPAAGRKHRHQRRCLHRPHAGRQLEASLRPGAKTMHLGPALSEARMFFFEKKNQKTFGY
jgi:cobalt-zinc-cadmium efflux system membrane fusion protein